MFRIEWTSPGNNNVLLVQIDLQQYKKLLREANYRVPTGVPVCFYHGYMDGATGIFVWPEPD